MTWRVENGVLAYDPGADRVGNVVSVGERRTQLRRPGCAWSVWDADTESLTEPTAAQRDRARQLYLRPTPRPVPEPDPGPCHGP